MKQKIKIAIELFLNQLSERNTRRVSLFFSKIKTKASASFTHHKWKIQLIRLCDFIIVRTNGFKFIEFELTNICNAQCIFCPYPDMLRTEKKFMNMSDALLAQNIEKLKHFKNALISFTPTTGDTLLHPEWDNFIEKIMQTPSVRQATFFTNAIKLDETNQNKLVQLLKRDGNGKMLQLYFSIGGLNAADYKTLYKVDRFELVVNQINAFLKLLKENNLTVGIHLHLKMLRAGDFEMGKAMALLNQPNYPFVYISHSHLYYSNDGYNRNAQIGYYKPTEIEKKKACSYLYKTRFAADGSVWADGCVISEMPNDSSLKLGSAEDSWDAIENARTTLINQWEQEGIVPKPCIGCTVYHCKK
jgi:wyosine [tRNA(Phe)-imidazoG37] synthetase (radical SAM superfamily)